VVERETQIAARHRLFFLENASAAREATDKKNAKLAALGESGRAGFPFVDEAIYNAETAERIGIWRLARAVHQGGEENRERIDDAAKVAAWSGLRAAVAAESHPDGLVLLDEAVSRLLDAGGLEGPIKAKLDHLAVMLDERAVDLAASMAISAITKSR
jgi:hypothetical protein